MALRRGILVYFVVLFALLAFSAQRLADLALGSFSWALVDPFLRPLVSAGFEMALLAAIPASVLCARASGLGLRGSLVWALVASVSSIAASLAVEPKGLAPGYVAQLLIDSGREACAGAADRRVRVPLVSLEWVCPEGREARASGALPGRNNTRYSAASLEVSADLRTISAERLVLEAPAGRAPFGLRLAAARATITGLPPWGRPSGPSVGERLTRAGLAAWAALLVGLFVLARYPQPPWGATLSGLVAGAVPLVAQRMLDRQGGSRPLAWVIVTTGAAAILLLLLGMEAVRRRLQRGRAVARASP